MQSSREQSNRAHSALFIATIIAAGSVAINAAIPGTRGMEASFDLASGSGARLIGTFVTGYALGHVGVALIAAKVSQKALLLLGLIGFVGCSVWIALMTDAELLTWLRGLQGFFAAVCPIIGRALVRQLGKDRLAAKRMSAASAMFAWAPVIAPLLAGWLLDNYGWRMIYVALAAYGAVCLTWVTLIPARTFAAAESSPRAWNASWQEFRYLSGHTDSRAGLIVGSLVFSGFFSFLAVSPNLLRDWSATSFSLATTVAVYSAGYAIGAAVSRLALNRFSDTGVLIMSLVVMIIVSLCQAGIALAGLPMSGLIACAFFYALAAGAAMPNATVLAMRPSAKLAPLALAILGVSKLLLAAAVTYLVTWSILPAAFFASTIMFAAAVGALIAFHSRRWRSVPPGG